MEASGILDVHLHDLLHLFGPSAYARACPWPLIGGLMGHSQASTMQRYAQPSTVSPPGKGTPVDGLAKKTLRRVRLPLESFLGCMAWSAPFQLVSEHLHIGQQVPSDSVLDRDGLPFECLQ